MPPFDFAGTDGELVNVSERRRVNPPGRAENFAQGATLVGLGDGAPDDHALDSLAQTFARRRDRGQIFAWRGSGHSSILYAARGRMQQAKLRLMRDTISSISLRRRRGKIFAKMCILSFDA